MKINCGYQCCLYIFKKLKIKLTKNELFYFTMKNFVSFYDILQMLKKFINSRIIVIKKKQLPHFIFKFGIINIKNKKYSDGHFMIIK